MDKLVEKTGVNLKSKMEITKEMSEKIFVIPPKRTRYLSEISDSNRAYDTWVNKQTKVAQELYAIDLSIQTIESEDNEENANLILQLKSAYAKKLMDLDPKNKVLIEKWDDLKQLYKNEDYLFKVRAKELVIKTHTKSLSQTDIPKISLPKYDAWGDLLRWQLQERSR